MPEEEQDVKPMETDPSPSPPPEDTGQTPTTSEKEPSGEQHMVPSGRLKEEADKRRALEQQVQQLQNNLQQLAPLVQQYQQYQQQQQQQAQAASRNGQPMDTEEELINATFGTDETGQKIRQVIDLLVERKIRQQNFVPRNEAERMAQTYVNTAMGTRDSGQRALQRIQNLVNQGLATQEEADELQNGIVQTLQNPQAFQRVQQDPGLLDMLVGNAIASQIESKKFTSVKQVRAKNPLQPSSTGPPPEKKAPDFNPADSPFPSIRNVSAEDAQKHLELSEQHYKAGR